MIFAYSRRAARNLAISSRKLLCALKKNERRGAKASTSRPASMAALDIGDGVGQREGHFLNRGGARFANVIAADGDGVPFGQFAGGPGEQVGDDAHGGAGRIDVGAARDVFLQDVVLDGAGDFARGRRPGCARPGRRSTSRIAAVELMVIDVVMSASRMPSKSRCMSASEQMATPTRPTSPAARG